MTSYLATTDEDDGNADVEHGLIAATVLLYLGIAITNALYQPQLHRFLTQVRGTLIGSIHQKALSLPAEKLSNNAMLTLTSADVNRIAMSLKRFDDLFATPLEVGVAIFLLERQVGVSCVAPVGNSILISAISFLNSNTAVPLQKEWLAAVTNRVAFTSSVLQSPKGFKMLGLTEYLSDRIQALRIQELTDYASYRKYVTLRNVQGAIPMAFAPAFTLMMFTLIKGGHALNPTVAFTALSLVSLLTSPIQSMIHAVPMFQTALASLDRIQAFLLLSERTLVITGTDHSLAPRSVNNESSGSIELATISAVRSVSSQPLIYLRNVKVRLGSEETTVLSEINLAIAPASLTMIVGPVSAGKPTLLKAIVGEVELAHGSRQVSRPISGYGFCAQDPWLPNGSVKELVIAESDLDDEWYHSVVSACALTADIQSFPARDDSIVGTKGVSLSGGQRQRLALARALYARTEVLVIDDVLSGLDVPTAKHVFDHVFGPEGLCTRHSKTTILASHAVQFLRHASHIVALSGHGTILEQGNFGDLGAPERPF